ncbi:selenium metabolism protein YedF [Thermosulfidibacter takaii ABI70S6]|uniref:Selenium metabolism protein YedF n=1 Tax=Thermosulfidibacter takaii (strain DSM 17441 / JCM 13301 / NBRC 103674 / ABI70S6) TaxID=1298851 RepID=A0A0S3QSM8_THET7|nr:sulfurtransferase-like selenium metabolism protein YedF [Thermosulfidibacter takaii]BAT71321.1 selenium metabolism protein YedF [Thermosulfidibacter takaii ABI70S6]
MVVDARGYPCPRPVLMTKEALEKIEEGVVEVLVDNEASKENVKRFAERQGCDVEVREEGRCFRLIITKGYTCELPLKEEKAETSDKVVLFLSDSMGEERELGQLLLRAFISTLKEASQKPSKLLFVNRGVFLTTEGSKVIDVLKELEGMGVEIYSCGTCLEYFGIKDKLKVGKVTNMYDTVENLLNADSVVRI